MHVNVYFVYVTRRRLIAFDPIGHSLLFPPVPFFIRFRTYLLFVLRIVARNKKIAGRS